MVHLSKLEFTLIVPADKFTVQVHLIHKIPLVQVALRSVPETALFRPLTLQLDSLFTQSH